MDDSRIRKAGDLLGSILTPDVAAKAGDWASFFGSWRNAAGDQLAAHSRPIDVRNGIVIIEADHPGWIQLLQMKQEHLLSAIARSYPSLEIRGIAFRLAERGEPALDRADAPAVRAPWVDREASPEPNDVAGGQPNRTAASVEETLEGIDDPGFRDILASLARTVKDSGE